MFGVNYFGQPYFAEPFAFVAAPPGVLFDVVGIEGLLAPQQAALADTVGIVATLTLRATTAVVFVDTVGIDETLTVFSDARPVFVDTVGIDETLTVVVVPFVPSPQSEPGVRVAFTERQWVMYGDGQWLHVVERDRYAVATRP